MKSSGNASQHHLLNLAKTGRLRLPGSLSARAYKIADRLYPLLAVFFTIALPFLASIPSICFILALAPISGISVFTLTGSGGEMDPIQLAIVLIAAFAPYIPGTWVWVWICERRRISSLGLEAQVAGPQFIRGLLLGCGLLGASVALSAIFGQVQFERPLDAANPLQGAGTAILLLAAWGVQGSAEEILLRGYLFPVVSIRYGITVGALASSSIFTMLHLLNSYLGWIGVLNLALFGVFAALYALAEGSIWGICGLHSAWNWTQGSLLGLPVSGSLAASGALLPLKENGPDWLTGGLFGPEGGLWVTIVLLAATGYLLQRELKRSKRGQAGAA